MKISKLFHWLYFSVMMLPIFIFPIFALAVRSDNNYQPISITVGEDVTETLHFNQVANNGQPLEDNDSYWLGDNVSYSPYTYQGVSYMKYDFDEFYTDDDNMVMQYSFDDDYTFFQNHKYYFTFSLDVENSAYTEFNYSIIVNENDILLGNETSLGNDFSVGTDKYIYRTIFTYSFADDFNSYFEFRMFTNEGNSIYYFHNLMLTDLTFMYGSGNEPILNDFLQDFNEPYYDYTLDTPIIIVVASNSVTYNDTDVGSQMVYVGYKVVDNYFNYDNVFNFGSLYSWLEINFFNGGAPLGFFIFWHLLIYWLLTSILWLIFDVLMYVPQLVHRWLDKASLS